MLNEGDRAVVTGARLGPARRSEWSARALTEISRATLRRRLYLASAVLDFILIAGGFGLAAMLHYSGGFDGLDIIMVVLPLYFVLAIHLDTYSIAALQTPREGITRAVRSLVIAVAIFLGIAFYLKSSAQFSRAVFGLGTIAAVGLLVVGRWSAGMWIGKRLDWNFTTNVVLVDGVSYYPQKGEIVLFADRTGLTPSLTDPRVLDRLGRLLKNADRVILACLPERRSPWTRILRGAAIDVEVLIPELGTMGAMSLRQLGSDPTVVVGVAPFGLRERLLKRALDLAITVPACVLLSPLLLAIAIAVKLESPGPILFRQARIGRGNRIFRVLKFRSMRVECTDQAGGRSARRADDRVTRVGAFLRRTSLDELPQLFNVLTGEMSLVGPRPHALGSTAEDQPFWVIERHYFDRHSVKPGMTGLAQVRGYRGATEVRMDVTNRVDADLEYIRRWSLGLDLLIMLRTVRVVASRRAF